MIQPLTIETGSLWFLTDPNNTVIGVTVLDVERVNGDWLVTVLNGDEFLQVHIYAETIDKKGYWAGLIHYMPTHLKLDRYNMQFRVDGKFDDRLEIV